MPGTWRRALDPAALLRWACLSLCYLAFAGTLSKAEGTAAALTGAFAAVLSLGLCKKGERHFSLRGTWAVVLARAALVLARDTGRVGWTLLRAIFRRHRGQVMLDTQWARHPLGSGTGHRAVTTLLASLTPDSMALETDDQAIPVHRLSRPQSARGRRRAR